MGKWHNHVGNFWQRVRVTKNPKGCCWLWVGGVGTRGYGYFWLNGRTHTAHRAAWLLFVGPIADGLSVIHKCDNGSCVNPAHLFLGTRRDIMSTPLAKRRRAGRAVERKPETKARQDEALSMRRAGKTFAEIGQAFGVSRQRAHQMVNQATYRIWSMEHTQEAAPTD